MTIETEKAIANAILQLHRAAKLASIAYDWDLGTDGKVEINDEWVSCSALDDDFMDAARLLLDI